MKGINFLLKVKDSQKEITHKQKLNLTFIQINSQLLVTFFSILFSLKTNLTQANVSLICKPF